jgi:hypothetical protein
MSRTRVFLQYFLPFRVDFCISKIPLNMRETFRLTLKEAEKRWGPPPPPPLLSRHVNSLNDRVAA